jgi:hypothetical protein
MYIDESKVLNVNFCESCGMPLVNSDDFANGDIESHFCCCCADDNGIIKPVEEIFWCGVKFFISQMKYDEVMAKKLMRKNMKYQIFWKDRDDKILNGELATDEEFMAMVEKCKDLKID